MRPALLRGAFWSGTRNSGASALFQCPYIHQEHTLPLWFAFAVLYAHAAYAMKPQIYCFSAR